MSSSSRFSGGTNTAATSGRASAAGICSAESARTTTGVPWERLAQLVEIGHVVEDERLGGKLRFAFDGEFRDVHPSRRTSAASKLDRLAGVQRDDFDIGSQGAQLVGVPVSTGKVP